MYGSILLVHSWIRWGIVVAAVYFFLRSIIGWLRRTPWAPRDDKFMKSFNQVFGFQILFGLALWISLSPMTKVGFKDPSLILENPVVAFWTWRHPLTMIFALVTFNVGTSYLKRRPPEKRFKICSVTFLVVLVMILTAIPWPGLSYGRVLFRW